MSQDLEHLKLRPPNDEQEKAISHFGGALLSAGAGSGKTFVLVEHIYYLFHSYYMKHRGVSVDEIIVKIKSDFSKIVIMTFTNKAAGELSLRLQKRFQQALDRSQHDLEDIPSDVLERSFEVIEQMYVGTIHGFCYRLLMSGVVSYSGSDVDIISDFEIKEKVKKVFGLWLSHCREDETPEMIDHILVNKNKIVDALGSIFSDPDLRLKWLTPIGDFEQEIEKACDDLLGFLFSDWRDSFSIGSHDVICDDKKVPKWVLFINEYENKVNLKSAKNFISTFHHFLKDFGRLPSVKEEKAGAKVFNFFQKVKEFKAFDKSYFEDLDQCFEKESELKSWHLLISRIFKYINEEYMRYPGVGFSDLEFSVYSALKENRASADITDRYGYFIIDEFQDTSVVQFEIINMMTKKDMSKVFSVGDVKQAIYGFRGGELGVFREAETKTYQNLTLQNNYRSEKNIIDFNNSFFTFLLPLSEGFEGEESEFTVQMTEQKVPAGKEAGEVIKHFIDCDISEMPEDKKSMSSAEINYLEAQNLASLIMNDTSSDICVLYTKLGASHFLLKELIKNDFPFRFQVKVSFDEDPLVSLFSILTNYHALRDQGKSDYKKKSMLLIKEVLSLLVGDIEENDFYEDAFLKSEKNSDSLGAFDSYLRFLWDLGISTSNSSESWGLIKTLCRVGDNTFHKLNEFIRVFTSGKYSLDFHFGQSTPNLTVMTVHASKGLEFDAVYLGGIHTNGLSRSSLGFFGKDEGSYKWYPQSSHKKAYKTPQYILELERNKKKEFGENKRLFYVALTRAVNKIAWCDLSRDMKALFYNKNSWVNALRKWEESGRDKSVLKIEESKFLLPYSDLSEKRLDLSPSMIHYSNLGMTLRPRFKRTPPLALFAELSVTRVTSLGDCPRKFYLKNYLKIELEDLGLEETQSFSLDKMSSSAERGTNVHESLSRAIKNNLTFFLSDQENFKNDKKALLGIEWVLYLLKEFSDKGFDFISEEAVKFSLFGQMVSGTPDLIIQSLSQNEFEVWDYKTGMYSEEKSRPYWLQLKLYAYALMKDNNSFTKASKTIALKLVFIDEQTTKVKKVNFFDLENELFDLWLKVEHLDQVNTEHCEQCSYRQICLP